MDLNLDPSVAIVAIITVGFMIVAIFVTIFGFRG